MLACGNPSRGDDALGPLLLAQLAEWLDGEEFSAQFELIEDFQFQIEHALDLEGRQAALFIDAAVGIAGAWSLAPLTPDEGPLAQGSHALAPAAVLAVCRRVSGPPPPAMLLCLRAASFGLGDALSPQAAADLAEAWPVLQRWCRDCVRSCRDLAASS